MRLLRRAALIAVPAALAAGLVAAPAGAHAGLTSSDPPAGARLGASPTAITLTFSEPVDPRLSTITVLGRDRTARRTASPQAVANDELALSVPLRPLPKGVYTIHWRVDSAVDGHATTGAFSFGVLQAPPQGAPGVRAAARPITSSLELIARLLLLSGLLALVGAAAAQAARFGDGARTDLLLALGGWALSVAGLLLLADAQRRSAAFSLGALLRSPVGHALIWRAVAIAAAGVALLLAGLRPHHRRGAMLGAGLAAAGAIVIHAANGHAAAGAWPSTLTVPAQAAHFLAAGIWIGGLGALLIGLRGRASEDKVARIRRFALVAAGGLAVVCVTGILRALSELRAWSELWSTGYGRGVLAKLVLVALIAALALRNRRRGIVHAAAANLRPLRRISAAELGLAAGAVAVAALLGTLAPPVAGRVAAVPGLSASGTDVGGTVRVRLDAVSNEPGPNRFVARITDLRSGSPVSDGRVQLLFGPLDDPAVRSSSLALLRVRDGEFAASGPNLRFDGRWAVRVLVRRPGGAVEVPLELDPVGPPQQVSIERIPGRPPTYTKLDGNLGFVRISPDPERPGPSRLVVSCYDASLGGEMAIRRMVVTLSTAGGAPRQQALQRTGAGTYVANIRLATGPNQLAVIAHTPYGTRLRSVFDLQVPGG